MTRRALTPVEVLFSLSVIVSATAVLAPLAAQSSPGASKTRMCLSNLKQDSTAIAIYEGDYDDFAPPAKKWMDRIFPYMKNERLLHCPEVAPTAYGYAYSSALAGKSMVKVARPAEEVMLFDSTLLTRSAVSTLKTLPKPGRHEGKNIISFSDTHTKAVSPK